MKNWYTNLITSGNFLQPILLLAIRLLWGWLFLVAGKGKLDDIRPVIDYFSSLGLPFPTLSAYAAGTAEFVGGACLLLGVASRLAALPLIITMIVAFLTAHYESIVNFVKNPQHLIQQDPFTFLLAALIIFAFGPGPVSIDGAVKGILNRSRSK